jgi:hypothetical protein
MPHYQLKHQIYGSSLILIKSLKLENHPKNIGHVWWLDLNPVFYTQNQKIVGPTTI